MPIERVPWSKLISSGDTMRIWISAMSLLILAACKQYQPASSLSNLASADAARECKNKHILSAKTGSKVNWQVTSTSDGKDTPISGSHTISGYMDMRGDELSSASGKFYFDSKSTSSGNKERDSKLMEIMFGLATNAEFSFLLTGVKGGTLSAGSAQGIEASGTLLIDGQAASIVIPMILTEQSGSYKLETKGDFVLNMRALKPAVNGMNLGAELTQLLSFVPGMGLKDAVSISMNIEMNDLCR
jgi:hypothetical protein